MNAIFLFIGIAVSLLIILAVGKYQLVSDNSFFYKSGRSMRPLDIFLAFEKKTFNERISKLNDPTRERFKKWLLMDMLLGFGVHTFVALLAIWCMTVYTSPVFIYIFYILALAQVVSFIFHVIADLIMRRSVDIGKLGMPMFTYNSIVIIKLVIPLIGLFMCVTTLILVWFQFLFSHEPAMATLFFLLPIFILTLILMRVMTGPMKKPVQ
jgi:hypothetical protein